MKHIQFLSSILAAVIIGVGGSWLATVGYQQVATALPAYLPTENTNNPHTAPTTQVASAEVAKIDFTKLPLNIIPEKKSLKIVIGGDMMFDRKIRAFGQTKGYDTLFDGVRELFQSADIGVANLEGPISNYKSKTLLADGKTEKDLIFTFATSTASAISKAGITLVSLANNHTDNFGPIGLEQTKSWLEMSDIKWFGDPKNASSTEAVVCKNDNCIAFVGYHEFSKGIDRTIADVKRLTALGYPVIVFAHWGDEYKKVADKRVRDKAKSFVSAGAIAIIGAHPHVTQNYEWIGDVPVIYSLGNLIFDQYFSPDVMKGQIAVIEISGKKETAHIEKVQLYNISNKSKTGPVLVGEAIELSR